VSSSRSSSGHGLKHERACECGILEEVQQLVVQIRRHRMPERMGGESIGHQKGGQRKRNPSHLPAEQDRQAGAELEQGDRGRC